MKHLLVGALLLSIALVVSLLVAHTYAQVDMPAIRASVNA
jgi:hypothetical protein